jgi:hypothetical protein
MTLIIALNAMLCVGVIAVVVRPLVWAIFTQHRDHVALAPAAAFGPKGLPAARRGHYGPARMRVAEVPGA